MKITIDYTDDAQKVVHDEITVCNKSDIVGLLRGGMKTSEVAIATIVNRELSNAPADIIRPNKVLHLTGAMVDIAHVAKSEKIKVTGKNGKEYTAPALTGAVADGSDEAQSDGGPSYVDSESRAGVERASNYLERIVYGHIWKRMLIIHNGGGDVKLEAIKLKRAIDEMVSKLA